jgi:hypothetical protein
MTSLKDIISQLRYELGKEESANKETILSLVDKIEPMAARDWARIKKLEKRMESFSEKTPEEFEQSMKDGETLKAELESSKRLLEEKGKQLEALSKEHSEKETILTKSLSEEKAAVARLLLDAGLTSELSKANVKPTLISAVKALIREKGILSVEGEGEIRNAVAKATKDGVEKKLSLSDWVKEFIASDEGKEFIAAKENAGSGAGEFKSLSKGDSTNSMHAEQFWGLPAKERSAFISSGGTITQN